MRFLWIGVVKDAANVRRDPSSLLIPIGIPLLLAALMNMVFGTRGQATPHGRLLVADEDRSVASSFLTGAFSRDPLSHMLVVEHVARADGLARMNRGQASALLIIPAGYQAWFLTNQPCRLELLTNPAERIVPEMIRQTIGIALDAGRYMQRTGSRAPLIQVESVRTAPAKAANFAGLFFPCMIFMSLMLVANSLAGEIWKERTAGTLRRLAATPAGMPWYLAGRLIFVSFVLASIGLVGVVAVNFMAGVPVANFPAAVAWVVFSGAVLYLCLLLLVMSAQTARTANVIGNLVIFPLALLGGCFFPFEAMPDWMVRIGKLTPNGWAILQFRAILDGAAQFAATAASAAGLLAIGGLAFLLAARRLRREFVL